MTQSVKIGILKGLLKRALKLCSDEEVFDKEIETLKDVFHNNNVYPNSEF